MMPLRRGVFYWAVQNVLQQKARSASIAVRARERLYAFNLTHALPNRSGLLYCFLVENWDKKLNIYRYI